MFSEPIVLADEEEADVARSTEAAGTELGDETTDASVERATGTAPPAIDESDAMVSSSKKALP